MEIDYEYKPVSLSEFPHICRFCLKGKNLKPLELYQYLLDLFKAITNIEVSHNDGLPGNTCSQCIQTLENIMDFVYLAENNDSNLRQTLVNRNDAEIEYDKMVIRGPGTDVISFQNFAHICRFCLRDNNLNPIQQHKYLLDVIKNKLAIEVDPDDNLPQNICLTCIKTLEDFSNFIISSKNNDGDLKQAIVKIKVEPEFDESNATNSLQTTDKIKLENENIVYIKTELVEDANEPNSNEDVDESLMQIKNEDVTPVIGCEKQETINSNSIIPVDHLKEEIQSECEIEEAIIIKQEYESIRQEEEMIVSENCSWQEPIAQFQQYETAMKAPVNPDPKPFHCTSCPKSYAYETQLTIHYRTHTGERPFRCPVCQRTFARSSNLSVHMKSHGDDGKAYSCNMCDMSFNRKSDLDGHLRLHGEKKFQCTTCLKHFANKQNLNTHMELHTGERAFKCPECPKGSDTEYGSGAAGSAKKKLSTEIVHKKCVTTSSRQDFEPSETQSTDYESRRLNRAPKTSAERGREFRARKALLRQQSEQQQEAYAIVEIATEDIRGAGPSEDNQVPGPSEIWKIEKRARSAEATRRWREKKRGVRSGSSKKPAKTAAQRMREYRKRKKLAKKIPLKQQSDQDLEL